MLHHVNFYVIFLHLQYVTVFKLLVLSSSKPNDYSFVIYSQHPPWVTKFTNSSLSGMKQAGPVDHESVASSSSTQLDGKEVTASLSERTRIGVWADSEMEQGYGSHPESRVQHKLQRPKQAYNPLAMEQGRQKHLFEGSMSSSWSVGAGDHEYPQLSSLSHHRVQESHIKSSKMLPVGSEQAKLVAMSTPSMPALSSWSPPPQFPSTYQVISRFLVMF